MHKPAIQVGTLLRINPSFITSSAVWDRPIYRSSVWMRNAFMNLGKRREGLTLSKQSRRKLSNAINWLCVSAVSKRIFDKEKNRNFSFKINFITLTIPHSENKISAHEATSSLLNAWLTYARKYFSLTNYIWKLEFTKKEVVHFHLTTDTFIHWKKLRDSWNNLLRRRGLLDAYYNEQGHYNANSTDVHATYAIKNITAYLCKYLLKDAYKSEIPAGRLWGCNYALSAASKCAVEIPTGEGREEFMALFSNKIKWKPIEILDKLGTKTLRLGEIFFTTMRNWKHDLKGVIKEAFEKHIHFLRYGYEEPPILAPSTAYELYL